MWGWGCLVGYRGTPPPPTKILKFDISNGAFWRSIGPVNTGPTQPDRCLRPCSRPRPILSHCHIKNKGVQTYLTLAHFTTAVPHIYKCSIYIQWIVSKDHAYYYAQHHSVLIFDCAPNIIIFRVGLQCHVNVTTYINACFIKKIKKITADNFNQPATFISHVFRHLAIMVDLWSKKNNLVHITKHLWDLNEFRDLKLSR